MRHIIPEICHFEKVVLLLGHPLQVSLCGQLGTVIKTISIYLPCRLFMLKGLFTYTGLKLLAVSTVLLPQSLLVCVKIKHNVYKHIDKNMYHRNI